LEQARLPNPRKDDDDDDDINRQTHAQDNTSRTHEHIWPGCQTTLRHREVTYPEQLSCDFGIQWIWEKFMQCTWERF